MEVTNEKQANLEIEETPALGKVQKGPAVRRQSYWNQWLGKLRECSAHLVGMIMQRAACDASASLRVFVV